MTRTCKVCGEIKEMFEFPKDSRSYNGYSYTCKTCKENKTDSRTNRLAALNDSKTPCEKCGETRLYLIDFHHRDNAEKDMEVVKCAKEHGVKRMWEERAKCICLCRNCHAEFHYLYGTKPANPVEALKEYLSD